MADPRLGGTLTANERLFDAALRHQVGLRRFASHEVSAIITLLEEADRDLVRLLRNRLGSVRAVPMDFTSARYQALLTDIRVARQEAMAALRGELSPVLRQFGPMEAEFERRLIQGSMPISVDLAVVDLNQLRAIATTRPFAGSTLSQWYSSLAASDQTNLTRQIQLGLSQGETLDQIVRRVVGTRANKYADGTLAITRRNAETVVRTAINGVSNNAREAVWQANSDLISALRWTSVLDGRTTPVCQARDGAMAPVNPEGALPENLPDGATALDPPGARPPAHPGCRSVMVAVIDGISLVGTRPSVTDTRTRERREVDFRAEARRTGRPISEIRAQWARENVGPVPAGTTYQDWLSRQPRGFQEDVLGKDRAALFRDGGLKLDQFVDSSGRKYTLAELARENRAAFDLAGI